MQIVFDLRRENNTLMGADGTELSEAATGLLSTTMPCLWGLWQRFIWGKNRSTKECNRSRLQILNSIIWWGCYSVYHCFAIRRINSTPFEAIKVVLVKEIMIQKDSNLTIYYLLKEICSYYMLAALQWTGDRKKDLNDWLRRIESRNLLQLEIF